MKLTWEQFAVPIVVTVVIIMIFAVMEMPDVDERPMNSATQTALAPEPKETQPDSVPKPTRSILVDFGVLLVIIALFAGFGWLIYKRSTELGT